MPLMQESIDIANWNQNLWTINHWGFNITEGHTRYEYRLYSRVATAGESPNRYVPITPDPMLDYAESAPLDGNYFVEAVYFTPTGGVLYSHMKVYNPAEDTSIEEWGRRFITEAKMHVVGISG
jgi:hypothetical protein